MVDRCHGAFVVLAVIGGAYFAADVCAVSLLDGVEPLGVCRVGGELSGWRPERRKYRYVRILVEIAFYAPAFASAALKGVADRAGAVRALGCDGAR
jgi:hypothetical protein